MTERKATATANAGAAVNAEERGEGRGWMRGDWTSPERFEELVREHQGMVFRTLTRLTGAGVQVEDLAQEVFLRLYKALPEFRGESLLSTYLYRIVVNVAQDEWKRRRKERSVIATEPAFAEDEGEAGWIEGFAGDDLAEHARSPEQRMQDAEMQHAVEAAVLGLPEMERAVLVLYHQEELSYEGIAAALGMPINTVRTHLHRGRKRLGEVLRSNSRSPEGMTERKATAKANAVSAEGAGVRGGGAVEARVVRVGVV